MAIFGFGKKSKQAAAENTEEKVTETEELQEEEKIELDGEAYYNFARMHEDQGDEDKALQEYIQSAELGYLKAQFWLGMHYEKEDGIALEESVKWYRKAAEQNYLAAQFNLGYMLYYGKGCKEDKVQGLEWIKKAAERGDEAAQEFIRSAVAMDMKDKSAAQAKQLKKEFLTAFLGAREFYFIYSNVTFSPFIGFNNKQKIIMTSVFTDKESADIFCKEMNEKNTPVNVRKIERQNLVKALGDLYYYGINYAFLQAVQNGEVKTMGFYLYDIVRRKDVSKLPVEKRPVENHALQTSMLIYMQEARKQNAPDKKSPLMQNLDRTMVANLMTSKYLLPSTETNVKDANGKTQIQLVVMTNNATGEKFIPLFTDNMEYNNFAQGAKHRLLVTDFSRLSNMVLPGDIQKFIVNPMGVRVSLTHEYIKKLETARLDAQKKRNEANLKAEADAEANKGQEDQNA